MKAQSAKAKGRKLQQWVCQKISEITGFQWGSSGDDKPIESRPMGQSGADVRMESEVISHFPFSIECKHQEKWNIHNWIEQSKENTTDGTYWLLICKKNRKKPVAVMDAEEFFNLLEKTPFYE